MLKPLKQNLINVISFMLLKSFYSWFVLFKCTNNFGSVFSNFFDRRMYKTKFPAHISFLFNIFYLLHHFLTFPLMLKTFLLFMTVAMLACYLSAVNCRSRNIKGNFMHNMNYCYHCHFPGIELTLAAWKSRGLAISRMRRCLSSQNRLLLGKPYWTGWLAMSLYPR
jgi:hypothetical protein